MCRAEPGGWGSIAEVPYWDYHLSMRVIAVSSLRQFWETHPDAEQPLKAWLDEVLAARWRMPSDVKASFGTASILAGRRVVFNIKGNDYRLVVSVAYSFGAVYIKFVGTHREYDQINVHTVGSST